MRISITSDYRKYQRKLQRVAGAMAETMAKTVNITAHAVDNKSHRNLQSSMILRNKYTERSLRVSDARVKKSGGTGYAEVGSISPYLPIQEKGGAVRAKRRRVAIPTRKARISGSERRVIASRFRMNKIGKLNARGGKYFTMNLRKPGIFYRPSKRRLVMLRDLSMRSIRIRPTRWHSSAVKQFGQQRVMQQVFIREAKKRLGVIR